MKTFLSKVKILALLAIPLIGFMACGTSGGDNMGQLSLSLTDKTSHLYTEVWVTLRDISVHMEGDAEDSWTWILDANKTVNLLTLSGIREELGIVKLTPGHYTQMRIMIGTENTIDQSKPANYVLDSKDGIVPLKIPSGFQSGIKLVQGFDINESDTTRLVFDFDVAASIVAAGNSGKYILRPTIHQIDDSQSRTNISGTVTDSADPAVAIAGAAVDLQIYKPRAEGQDFKDEITSFGTTTTDSSGKYLFWFLDIPDPLPLNVVATNWNSTDEKIYIPAWDQVPGAVNGNAYERNFKLGVSAENGTLDLSAIVADTDTDKVPDDTNFVTLSIRKLSDLPETPMVEVKKLVIVGGDDDWTQAEVDASIVKVDLPIGDYAVVASFGTKVSLETLITISVAGPNKIAFSFPL